MWGSASLAMEKKKRKKKISTVVEKKIVSLQVSNHEDLSRIKLNNGRSNRRELLISGHMISSA